jgi:small subunit ribosomal protein S6
MKGANMRLYEAILILDPRLDEEGINNTKGKFENSIKGYSGSILYFENWGLRTFSYPIKHKNEGYYLLFQFGLPAEKVVELERMLRINEDVLRFQIVKFDRKKQTQSQEEEKDLLEKASQQTEQAEEVS